jgi:H+/Cl- antiporter ClcA
VANYYGEKMKGYPEWFGKKIISLFILVLSASGVLLIPNALKMRFDINSPLKYESSTRILMTSFHLLVAYFAISLIGAIWAIHMRREWRRKKNIWSGLFICFIFGVLAISSLSILYSGNELISNFSSLIHIVLGLLLPLGYLLHLLLI